MAAVTRVVAFLAVAACSTSAGPPPRATHSDGVAPASSAPAALDAASGDHVMIEQIQDLVRFLSRDPLTFDDVVARVGPVTDDPGVPQSASLRPTALKGVRAVRLARYPRNGLPYTLTLDLADGAGPTAAALKAAFGEYDRARTDRGHPPTLMFPPVRAAHWQVVVMADLPIEALRAPSLDDAAATRIEFRRDPL